MHIIGVRWVSDLDRNVLTVDVVSAPAAWMFLIRTAVSQKIWDRTCFSAVAQIARLFDVAGDTACDHSARSGTRVFSLDQVLVDRAIRYQCENRPTAGDQEKFLPMSTCCAGRQSSKRRKSPKKGEGRSGERKR
jgi:hypothetical protein